MATPILVTGGAGNLGRHVVQLLRDAGHDVRVLSRSSHENTDGIEYITGDLDTGSGVDAAVQGVQVIVHCAGTAKGDELKTRNLGDAALGAGARHLVFISVVGADRVPVNSRIDHALFGYFASKRGAELAVEASGVPWTTLRATQFHDLMFKTAAGMAKLPVIPVPAGMNFQPVETAEVAAELVSLALASPAGLVPDIAGPRIYSMDELVRTYLESIGKRRPMVHVPIPGNAARAVRAGAILAPERAVGHRTWEDYLAEHAAAQGDRATVPSA
jgi:uncharacterized protein YbjT (DUF2867 family)